MSDSMSLHDYIKNGGKVVALGKKGYKRASDDDTLLKTGVTSLTNGTTAKNTKDMRVKRVKMPHNKNTNNY